MEEEFKKVNFEIEPKKSYKKIKIFSLIAVILIFSFVTITASIYVAGSSGTNNAITNAMSANENRTAFVNSTNGENAFIDDKGNIAGRGDLNISLTGYFQWIGSSTLRVTKIWADSADITSINSSEVNSTEVYQDGNKVLDLSSSISTYNATYDGHTEDNATWSESRADTLYSDIIWGYNMSDGSYNVTYLGAINNASYLSTYNSTYASNTGDNSSWNQSRADELYSDIKWGYNQTTATYNLYNNQWTSTYNATYLGSVNNASYLSTYNATYDGKTNSPWVSTATSIYNTTSDIGIGTATPKTKLDVVGNMSLLYVKDGVPGINYASGHSYTGEFASGAVPISLYGYIRNDGTVNTGHALGVLGLAEDVRDSKFALIGVEGRVDGVSNQSGVIYEGLRAYTTWTDSSSDDSTAFIGSLYGIDITREITDYDGTTPRAEGISAGINVADSVGGLANVGIMVRDQTGGAVDYGIVVEGSDSSALWLSSLVDTTDSANGITFGLSEDIALYRSGVSELSVDGSIIANKNSKFGSSTIYSTFGEFDTAGAGVGIYPTVKGVSNGALGNMTVIENVLTILGNRESNLLAEDMDPTISFIDSVSFDTVVIGYNSSLDKMYFLDASNYFFDAQVNSTDFCISGTGTCLSTVSAGGSASPWKFDATSIYNSTANVGIGTSDPIWNLEVVGNVSLNNSFAVLDGAVIVGDTTGDLNLPYPVNFVSTNTKLETSGVPIGNFFNTIFTPASTSSALSIGLFTNVGSSGTSDMTALVGHKNAIVHESSGDLFILLGQDFIAESVSQGTISQIIGVQGVVNNGIDDGGSGIGGYITNAISFETSLTNGLHANDIVSYRGFSSNFNVKNGTVGSLYGSYYTTPTVTGDGVISNAYGIYLEDFSSSSANPWGIYSQGNNWAMRGTSAKLVLGAGASYLADNSGGIDLATSGATSVRILNASGGGWGTIEYGTAITHTSKDEGLDTLEYFELGADITGDSDYGECSVLNNYTNYSRPEKETVTETVRVKKSIKVSEDNNDFNPEDLYEEIERTYEKITFPHEYEEWGLDVECYRAKLGQGMALVNDAMDIDDGSIILEKDITTLNITAKGIVEAETFVDSTKGIKDVTDRDAEKDKLNNIKNKANGELDDDSLPEDWKANKKDGTTGRDISATISGLISYITELFKWNTEQDARMDELESENILIKDELCHVSGNAYKFCPK